MSGSSIDLVSHSERMLKVHRKNHVHACALKRQIEVYDGELHRRINKIQQEIHDIYFNEQQPRMREMLRHAASKDAMYFEEVVDFPLGRPLKKTWGSSLKLPKIDTHRRSRQIQGSRVPVAHGTPSRATVKTAPPTRAPTPRESLGVCPDKCGSGCEECVRLGIPIQVLPKIDVTGAESCEMYGGDAGDEVTSAEEVSEAATRMNAEKTDVPLEFNMGEESSFMRNKIINDDLSNDLVQEEESGRHSAPLDDWKFRNFTDPSKFFKRRGQRNRAVEKFQDIQKKFTFVEFLKNRKVVGSEDTCTMASEGPTEFLQLEEEGLSDTDPGVNVQKKQKTKKTARKRTKKSKQKREP